MFVSVLACMHCQPPTHISIVPDIIAQHKTSDHFMPLSEQKAITENVRAILHTHTAAKLLTFALKNNMFYNISGIGFYI